MGLTEAAARKAGRAIRTVEYDLAAVSGATVYSDDYVGRAKLVLDDDRDVADRSRPSRVRMWASCCSRRRWRSSARYRPERLWHAVPSYPTLSEVWLRLFETYGL